MGFFLGIPEFCEPDNHGLIDFDRIDIVPMTQGGYVNHPYLQSPRMTIGLAYIYAMQSISTNESPGTPPFATAIVERTGGLSPKRPLYVWFMAW